MQLRAMNDEAASGRQKDPITNRHSETFQRAYAAVVLQLKQARLLPAEADSCVYAGQSVEQCSDTEQLNCSRNRDAVIALVTRPAPLPIARLSLH